MRSNAQSIDDTGIYVIVECTIDKEMVGLGEFESPTSSMSTMRSNQLSYSPPEVEVHYTFSLTRCKYNL